MIASEAVAASGTDPLKIRIGINYAEVMITEDDVFGDGVNVAARLEQHALPDILE
ncbi:adenylate/guanylate cyclase domain-containing protein [Rhizobium ruizarguesonis]|uniref:adenylate/guanylate cyclase domain-containing protein n=1 Tax=Rhizobium ruizarguesonis TaxID=2081791 RepID=UPI001FEF3AAC|nr:adenylate/guanylate cyclase domain-containing protein [Rhizobium ruizarguesonis]